MKWILPALPAFVASAFSFAWAEAQPPQPPQPLGAKHERIAEPIAPRNIQILVEKDASEALLEVKRIVIARDIGVPGRGM